MQTIHKTPKMTDYSMFYKTPVFSMENPRPREKSVCFKIVTFNASSKIKVPTDASLEDLYIKIHNAVYPEFSTERGRDDIPSANTLTYVPRIYNVSMVTSNDKIVPIPIHRFITLSSFMQANRNCFTKKFTFGSPLFNIFVLNEESLALMEAGETLIESHSSYLQKYLGCYA
jgi:hypothetical protein